MKSEAQEPRDDQAIGPDRVIRLPDGAIIYAAREMPDWQIREFCKIPILFEGRKFYLLQKHRTDPPYALAYELSAWPDDLHEESPVKITYDEGYVARREQEARQDSRDELVRFCLLPFYPFLGYLWSRFKDDSLERFGFQPRPITAASITFSLGVILLEGIFLGFVDAGWLASSISPRFQVVDFALFGVLLVDSGIRMPQLFGGVESPDGLLEWLLRPFRDPPAPPPPID